MRAPKCVELINFHPPTGELNKILMMMLTVHHLQQTC
jgi:hypothetical protein